eukprot:CAMPEP_0181205606 /NCGR_PEP_ID=MMETSP1096-20121128/20571_1 /TAXON_ID=156174 ORGANISM="Chrysochromulina ericina, Strain CCMP281" /NCGR_SAMPLE_ID=MMETSP1096 /ASSEMBLY_ACC=CAM_ASM_000453 /LENGTH=172 /DNA_ID=CAMNT_0023296409 /DNA_START=736 /DNA_END=1252 /DNA_ORIENTATION=-
MYCVVLWGGGTGLKLFDVPPSDTVRIASPRAAHQQVRASRNYMPREDHRPAEEQQQHIASRHTCKVSRTVERLKGPSRCALDGVDSRCPFKPHPNSRVDKPVREANFTITVWRAQLSTNLLSMMARKTASSAVLTCSLPRPPPSAASTARRITDMHSRRARLADESYAHDSG